MRFQSRGQGQGGHGVAAHPSRWRRRAALSAVALAALALGAGPASAGEREDPPRPDDDAVVSVYREVLPRASGPKADDGGGGERRPLPAAVETQIDRVGGADSKALKDLATAARYGAPQEQLPPSGGAGQQDGPALAGTLADAVSPAAGGGTGGLRLLVIALALVTASLGAAAVLRRRS